MHALETELTLMHSEPAKIIGTFLGFHDHHGRFTAELVVNYGGSSQRVGGYVLDGPTGAAFIQGILKAAGVDSWEKVNGRVVQVIQDREWGRVLGLEPMKFEPGERFLFADLERQEKELAQP